MNDERSYPLLLTPGPLTTSARTKAVMLKDWGSWDYDFKNVTKEVRERMLAMCEAQDEYECVPMQGSGTFSVESALATFLAPNDKILVLANGHYGQRIIKTLQYMRRKHVVIDKGDYLPPTPAEVEICLTNDPSITHVIIVHCETSSGVLNPVEEIFAVVKKAGRKFIIDSMSAFGAIPISVKNIDFDCLVTSANKCIEGVPGFGLIIAKRSTLEATKGNSPSLSLDAYDQWLGMENNGQWRFTPPTHALVAFREALLQHEEEGGVRGRLARYNKNKEILINGMRELGFETLLSGRWLSPIIVTFFQPGDPKFNFQQFYDAIREGGFVIYPGKTTEVESFRIGCIGQLYPEDIRRLIVLIGEVCDKLGIADRSPSAEALKHRQDNLL